MDANRPLLLQPRSDGLSLPPLDQIAADDFEPALRLAMAEHAAAVDAVAAVDAAPDVANTAAALDRAGTALDAVESLLFNLSASASSPALQAVERRTAAPLAAHWSAVQQHGGSFARLRALQRRLVDGELAASAEQRRLVERQVADSLRAGAALPTAERAEFGRLEGRLAQWSTAFAHNVLHDEAGWTLALDAAALDALPTSLTDAAAQAAEQRGLAQPVVALNRTLVDGFLAHSPRRDLRQAVWRAWVGRGAHAGPHDNRPLAAAILGARQRQAALLGYANYADFKLADSMAGSRTPVWALLDEVWQRAQAALVGERELLLQAMADAGVDPARTGADGQPALAAWDWRWWSERVRQRHFALDEAALRAYFPLPAMVQAAFDCAERLFGVHLRPRPDLRGWQPEQQVYEVVAAGGAVTGLFIHDNFSRPTKRSGAWMSRLQPQHRNRADGGAERPLVINCNNFAPAPPGQPVLLSVDDVRTLFHEFGHALHGLLSDVGYARLSGTRVLRDFVELPSQLFEHWGRAPQVLRRHARHWQSGEPLPEPLIDRLRAARRFGQAYDSVRYTASAIVDLAAHERAEGVADVVDFEQRLLAERGLPQEVGVNHRLPHFQHLFSGSAYAAGYYVYLWAERLSADAWQAFGEAGDVFDAATAARLRAHILSRGDSVEPGAAYRAFRGRDAELAPLLRERGLLD